MTSLTEAYDGNAREVTSLRRLYTGTGLVLLGAVLSVIALVVATTDLFSGAATSVADPFGTIEASAAGSIDHYASVRLAGVMAGLGVPAALVGVFLVLPAGRWVRAAGAISASLCLFGVTLFWYAYPIHWRGMGDDLTLQVSAVYLLGLFIAVWCLFTAVVNFKTRNDPGGMLEMNVTRHNQTVVEAPDSEPESTGFGGVGFFGETPDGNVETQTNTPDEHTTSDDATSFSYDGLSSTGGQSQTQSRGSTSSTRRAGVATSDGGSAASDISSPLDGGETGDGHDAEIVESPTANAATESAGDNYCGNCRHFEYVRSSSGIVPYCGRHEQAMDDMDACEEWGPNRR
ncbi:DUF7139 domain-containing protein [Natrarchaeobaculum sulfurireducens]|uniref:Uncharacterized protein n=1 Tax=Natrarchaeobaculum sulfurireducens TaxID=2044521 RepID=A0A346PM73_9EURY|nr:hypothetical protein [Natrarchaeobaculum sulfurireducens]AXR76951.1 hypothetical protein AArc1_0607 [Natrarchaeobaculum sulfurireducens]AXR80618.1 hypothetical protein AArcMg_0595 [Natrarchaeobaculum sulfurireducens]